MPNTFRCQCGATEIRCCGRPDGWLLKSRIGGAIVFCPKCRSAEDEKDRLDSKRQRQIDMRVETYRKKLEQEITIESIRQEELEFFSQIQIKRIE